MDQTYQILTDATADLSAEIVEEFGLKVIPMPITLGGKTFHHHYDYREMSSRDFYDAIRAGAEVSTAQINLMTYLRACLSCGRGRILSTSASPRACPAPSRRPAW